MTRTRLLVVDDDDSVAKLISRIAEKLDFHTETANGFNSAAVCESFLPDVIVLDICMPDIDGFEVMHHLAEYNSKVAIVILSAQPASLIHMAEDMGKELGLRIVDTVSKPFTMSGLEDVLRRVHQVVGISKPQPVNFIKWLAHGSIPS